MKVCGFRDLKIFSVNFIIGTWNTWIKTDPWTASSSSQSKKSDGKVSTHTEREVEDTKTDTKASDPGKVLKLLKPVYGVSCSPQVRQKKHGG